MSNHSCTSGSQSGMPGRHLWVSIFLLLSITLSCKADGQSARPPDHELVQKLNQIWGGVETIHFKVSSSIDDKKRGHVFDLIRDLYWERKTGRSHLVFYHLNDGRELEYQRAIEDGKRLLSFANFDDGSGAVREVRIDQARSRPGQFRAWDDLCFLFFLPDGMMIDDAMRDPATLAGSTPNQVVLPIVSMNVKATVTIDFDPKKNYSPSRLLYVNEKFESEVNAIEFATVDQVTYPSKLRATTREFSQGRDVGVSSISDFAFVSLELNKKMPDSAFTLKPQPRGVLVEDRIRKTSHTEGGYLARQELQKAHPSPERKEVKEDAAAVPVEVPSDPPKSFAPQVLLFLGIVSGASAVFFLLLRSSRQA